MISEPPLVALREEQRTAEQPSCVDHDSGATHTASTRKIKKNKESAKHHVIEVHKVFLSSESM